MRIFLTYLLVPSLGLLFVLVLVLLTGCSALNIVEKLSDKPMLHDLVFVVDGVEHKGTAVLPRREKYQIQVKAAGPIDFLQISTCNRHVIVDVPEGGFFSKKKNKEQAYEYIPNKVEREVGCDLGLVVLDKNGGKHGFAYAVFEAPELILKAIEMCNGGTADSSGTSICQSMVGREQGIRFLAPVEVVSDCELPMKLGNEYRYNIAPDKCTYMFGNRNGKFRLATHGYERVIWKGE